MISVCFDQSNARKRRTVPVTFAFDYFQHTYRMMCKTADTQYFEPQHDKTNEVVSEPSEDSDHPGHPPSLTRVFAVHSMDS